MTKEFHIHKSDKKTKKYYAQQDGKKKKIYFGATGYEDYTMHKNNDRKTRYDSRHKKNESWNNPNTAGFWSKWILWNKPSIKSSINDINKNKNLIVKLS